jgi:hypothetical protein
MMMLAVQSHKVIAHDILPQGETVDGQRFRRFLIESLCPNLIQTGIHHPVILMNNAKPHYHHIVTEYL